MTDKAKLYAVKSEEGEWLSYGTKIGIWYSNNPTLFKDKSYAEAQSMGRRAHVVTLIEEQKVKLPREVGEDLEDWLKTDNIDDILDKIICIYDGDHSVVRNWWASTIGATYLIADMARYGWEAEPEAKWYVQTPKEWWEDSAIPEWMHFDTLRGVCSGFSKLGRTAFTRAELKQYNLDSDIFTLVPVEEEK